MSFINSISYFAVSLLLFFCLSFYLSYQFIKKKVDLFDRPDGIRKIHYKPVLLGGGILFFVSLIIIFSVEIAYGKKNIFENNFELLSIILGSTFFFLLGLFDDKHNISPITKLILSIIILYLVINVDNDLQIREIRSSFLNSNYLLNDLSIFFTIICILIFINAFNLFDGIDLQSILYFIIISLINIFYFENVIFLYLLIPSILFLILNYKKEIFMGDNGTLLLSFLISYFSIKNYNEYSINSDLIFIYMIVPGIDMMRLFILRIYSGKSPFEPDRKHLHHYLSNNYGLYIANVILIFLILLPIFLTYLLQLSILISIFASITVYFIIYFKVKNEKNRNK